MRNSLNRARTRVSIMLGVTVATVAVVGGVLIGTPQLTSATSEGAPTFAATFVDPNTGVLPYQPCLCPVCAGQLGASEGISVNHWVEASALV